MKFWVRGRKQSILWTLFIAFAVGIVLFTCIYHRSAYAIPYIKREQFESSGEERGREFDSSNDVNLMVSDGQTVNNSVINKTIGDWYNKVAERPDKKVPNVSYDVCKKAHFAPAQTYPLIALASVPGSGNTWVRYLLERASGFYTGSVYRDKKLFQGGFKGEMGNPLMRKTIIVKTHDTGTSLSTSHYKGGVIIIRNPYDTLLAYANLVHAGHTGWADGQYFNSSKWDKFVESASIAWEDRITTWIDRTNVMVVFFEHLKSDLRHQITRILDFLHVPIDEDRLDCVEAYPEGRFHRLKSEKNQTFNPYKERHKAIIEKHIQSASKALRKYKHIDYELAYEGISI